MVNGVCCRLPAGTAAEAVPALVAASCAARKHDIAMFHLLDPQEVDFHFERPHRFVDLEDGSVVVAEPNLIVDEYHEALREFLETVETKCHNVHADYHLLQTNANYEKVVSDFITSRLTKKR